MFRVIFPNRWLIWSIVFAIIVAMFLWWQIELYTIDSETQAIEAQNSAPVIPQKPAAASIDTSAWKAYRNEKYGFEFKYPPDFVQEKNPFNQDDLLSIGRPSKYPDSMKDQWPCGHGGSCLPPDALGIAIDIANREDFDRIELNDGVNKFIVNGHNGLRDFNGNSCGEICPRAFVYLEDDQYIEFYGTFNGPEAWKEAEDILNTILSTLKFFEATGQ